MGRTNGMYSGELTECRVGPWFQFQGQLAEAVGVVGEGLNGII